MKRARTFTVQRERACDTLVVGGGTTGIAAALASARAGAATTLVEQNGYLGGTGCCIPCWMGYLSRAGEPVLGGLPLELLDRLRVHGAASPVYPDPICGGVAYVNPHWLKIVALEVLREAGVELLLHTRFVGVEKSGRRIAGVDLWTAEGLARVEAGAVVDCTDWGAVARAAGETLDRGRAADGKVQVASWVFEVRNIDFAALGRYLTEHPDDLRPFPLPDAAGHIRQVLGQEGFVAGAFGQLVARAEADGMKLPRANMPGVFFPRSGNYISVASRVEDVDPGDSVNHTRAEIEGAGQVATWLAFLRRYVPGCAACELGGTFNAIAVRETNHLRGLYTLTGEDLMDGRVFDDAVALGAYHLDIHSPDHKGLETNCPKVYQIPFRALVPRGTDNLLVAGRAISATHEAQSSTRVIPISMAQGEAAGTAAGQALREGTSFADLDTDRLRRTLTRNGVPCGLSGGDTAACRRGAGEAVAI